MRARQSLQWSSRLKSTGVTLACLVRKQSSMELPGSRLLLEVPGQSLAQSSTPSHSLSHTGSIFLIHVFPLHSVDWRLPQAEMSLDYRDTWSLLDCDGFAFPSSTFPGLSPCHYFPPDFDFMFCIPSNCAYPDSKGTFPLWFRLIVNQTWPWVLLVVLSRVFRSSLAWISPFWHHMQEAQDLWNPSLLSPGLPHSSAFPFLHWHSSELFLCHCDSSSSTAPSE